jgi:hypothetical protein
LQPPARAGRRHAPGARAAAREDAALATGATIYNFSGLSDADPERVKLGFAPADYARLARAKAIYDPQNMFRINFNIPPAS